MFDEVESIINFQIEKLQEYLESGLNPDSVFHDETLIEISCNIGNEKAALLLISAGANVNRVNNSNETLLMLSSYSGMVEVQKSLLNSGVPLNAVDEMGRDALMFAAKGGHAESVELLCQAGAVPTRTDIYGRAAVQWALVDDDHTEVVKTLISYGSFDSDQAIQCAAMQYAIELGRHRSAEIIRTYDLR